METTKPRTVNSIGMFDMLKGAGMLAIVLGHTAELYPLQLEGGLSLTAFVGFIYRETLMAAFFIASGYGFRKRSISKCIHQQLKSLLKPFCYTAVFTTVLHFIIHYKTFHYLPGSMTESIKVAGGFLLGLPHTATYFGQEFFSCGPMWYLLALLMGWILLDVILNIFPEKYTHWAVLGIMLLGCGVQGFALMALNRKFKIGYALYSLFWFIAGLFLVIDPLMGASFLMIVLGIWFVLHAIELFTAALADKLHPVGFRWLVALNGLVTLAFGILIATSSIAAIGFFNLLFAFFLIFYGAITIGVAMRFRRIGKAAKAETAEETE